jgi:hypothetical protein
MRLSEGPRRPARQSARGSRTWILALLLILSPMLTSAASPPSAPPPFQALSIEPDAKIEGPQLITLTEAELAEIIREAVDEAVARSVQVAVATGSENAAALRVERDSARELLRLVTEAKVREVRRWQLATLLAALLAAGSAGGMLALH